MSNCNHTGIHFLIILGPLAATLLCSMTLLAFYRKSRLAIVAVVINIAAITFFLALDYFNIMVQYDTWLERGMPEPFAQVNAKTYNHLTLSGYYTLEHLTF